MKNPDRDTVSQLDALPNIGKSMTAALHVLGIDHPKKLVGMDPFTMYEDFCAKTGKRQDPCVIDVFMSAVHFMKGGEPLPWWSFTQERKNHIPHQGSHPSSSRGPKLPDQDGRKG